MPLENLSLSSLWFLAPSTHVGLWEKADNKLTTSTTLMLLTNKTQRLLLCFAMPYAHF